MWRNHAPTDASSLDPSEPNSGAKCRTRDSGHRARQANEVCDALHYDRAEASIFWARPRSGPQLQRVFTAQLPGSAFENLIAAIRSVVLRSDTVIARCSLKVARIDGQ